MDYRKAILERLQEMRLLDDELMTKCFEGNVEAAELLLHTILGDTSLKVLDVQTQYDIKNLQGRSVKLDVYAKDENDKRYNIEIQRARKGAGVKRARYHSSILDANACAVLQRYFQSHIVVPISSG